MQSHSPAGPVLACYDGSQGSHQALRSGGLVVGRRKVVVLTIWQPIAAQLARIGSFGPITGFDGEEQVDLQEQRAAAAAADEGAQRASELGFDATSRVEETRSAVWEAIVGVADDIDAVLILCGSRGRSSMETALLGSTSHGVLHHAHRPVLIAPQARSR